MPVAFYLMMACGLPLVGFVVLVLFGRRIGKAAGVLATGLVMGSLGLSIAALAMWVAKDAFNQSYYVEATGYRWLAVANAARGAGAESGGVGQGIFVGTFIDSLTVAMFVMVTFIASLVHLFSIAWMGNQEKRSRYFAFLNLFVFGVLGVILSNSLVQVLAFWEIAGVASMLLVGFWFERRGPAMGGLKSAVVNAIGNVAFLMGMGILVMHVGTAGLNFSGVQGASMAETIWAANGGAVTPSTNPSDFWAASAAGAAFLSPTIPAGGGFLGLAWMTWAGLLLFAGAAAKAAQFPLHVWLPDAMEAPAPVSALVHGSTLVATGVYVVARIYPILTIDAHLAIAIIGCVTLLLGALLALVQFNLRRILAYSVISQLGYMMLFLGAGGYTAGLVHLFTHSFFSACLFLSAACVIQAVKGQEDIRQMGGLWRKLPMTALGFVIASLALVGVPLFSGAYSRGLGLASVYEYAHMLSSPKHARAGMVLFYVPALVSFVTAFYVGRCWWLVFAGKSRNEDLAEAAHEPFLMVLPIGMLAVLSVNFYEFFLLPSLVHKSLPGVTLGGPRPAPTIGADHVLEGAKLLLTGRVGGYAFWGFLGVIPAVLVYYGGLGLAERLRRLPAVNLVCLWLREGMYLDAIYNGVLVRAVLVAGGIVGFVDRYVLGAVVRFVVLVVRGVSGLMGNVDRHVVDGVARGGEVLGRGNEE